METIEEETKNTIKTRILSTSHLWKVAAVLFVIGYIFHLISFGAPFWIVVSDVNNSTYIGIWNSCTSIANCVLRDDNSDCLTAVRVFHGLATVGGLVMSTVMILYVKSPESRKYKAKSNIIVGFVSALCMQIGTGIFGRSYGCGVTADLGEITWGWSLALSITSVVLFCVVVLLLVLNELREIASKGHKERKRGNHLGLNIT